MHLLIINIEFQFYIPKTWVARINLEGVNAPPALKCSPVCASLTIWHGSQNSLHRCDHAKASYVLTRIHNSEVRI